MARAGGMIRILVLSFPPPAVGRRMTRARAAGVLNRWGCGWAMRSEKQIFTASASPWDTGGMGKGRCPCATCNISSHSIL
jgi:hypothetical protein